MRIQLELQYPCKGLLTGHRGAGKSSALTKLSQTLEDRKRLWVVHFSILDKLDLNDLTYVDIIFLMAAEIVQSCVDRQIDLSGHDQRLQTWVQEVEIIKEEEQSSSLAAASEAKLSTPKLGWVTLPVQAFLSVSGKVGKEVSTRTTVREQLEPQFSELLGIIDDIQQAVFATTQKRVACLVDGLDKASIETAENLFYQNGFSLTAPHCSIIYAFPIALRHSQNFNQIAPYFGNKIFMLPNFKVQLPKKKIHNAELETQQAELEKAAGIKQLGEVITRRVEYHLFDDDALEKLVYFSGGIVRTAIALAQNASIKALVKDASKVTVQHVEDAIAEERRSFGSILSNKQKDLLAQVKETETIDADPEAGYLDLLHNLSVIQYSNGNDWYGVSPIAAQLL